MKVELKPNTGVVMIGEHGITIDHYFLKDYPEEKAETIVELLKGIVGLVEYAPELVVRMSDFAFEEGFPTTGGFIESDDVSFEPDPKLVKAMKAQEDLAEKVIDFSKILTSRRKH
jgi:hypothetical protein